jgi:hypothetical protein
MHDSIGADFRNKLMVSTNLGYFSCKKALPTTREKSGAVYAPGGNEHDE